MIGDFVFWFLLFGGWALVAVAVSVAVGWAIKQLSR